MWELCQNLYRFGQTTCPTPVSKNLFLTVSTIWDIFTSYANEPFYNQIEVLQWLSSDPNTKFYSKTISKPYRAFISGWAQELNIDFDRKSHNSNESFYIMLSSRTKHIFSRTISQTKQEILQVYLRNQTIILHKTYYTKKKTWLDIFYSENTKVN